MGLKEDRIGSGERISSLFEYRRPDRIPINMVATGFSCRNAGLPISVAYGDPNRAFFAMRWAADQYNWDQIPQIVSHTVVAALDFGGEVRLPKSEYEGAMVVQSFPVKSQRDVEKLELPDPKKSESIQRAIEMSRLQEAHGLPVTFVSRSPFTFAANLCGLQQFCKWLLKAPELCERLMRISMDHITNVLQYWVDVFTVENVFVFMSSPSEANQIISPQQFEKFALPYHIAFHERLREMGVKRFCFHICGDQRLNLPCLADMSPWYHPAILSFGHELSLESCANYFPRDIIFGNIEPALIMTATAEKVYGIARSTIEMGKKLPGGFILSAGCELPVTAPPANVFAITKAVNDFGWYI